MPDKWFWAMFELTSTLHNFTFGQLQPNLELPLDLIYFLVEIHCELEQIMTSYDLLHVYGTDEWFWAMFTLDWSNFELDRSYFFCRPFTWIGNNYIVLMDYLSLSLCGCVFCRFQNTEHLHEFYKQICVNGMNGSWTQMS